ncbi:NDNL2 (predicted) [Pycnogonum litorale]
MQTTVRRKTAAANNEEENSSSDLLSSSEIKKLAYDTVYYMLHVDHKKVPLKRVDINKNVLKENSRSFPPVIAEAREILSSVFGIDLVEVKERKGLYFLINKINGTDENSHLVWPNADKSKSGLLFVILSLIFMNGNVMTDNILWLTLKKMGVDPDSIRPHSTFGNVKKLITTEFVRQLYLEYNRVEGKDPPVYEFKWGPRADLEISKRDILGFVCHVSISRFTSW